MEHPSSATGSGGELLAGPSPLTRSGWFRSRALEIIGSRALVAFDLDKSAPDEALAFAASVSAGIAHLHGQGATLGHLQSWATGVIGDAATAGSCTFAVYQHVRIGTYAPARAGRPSDVFLSMLSWLALCEGTAWNAEGRAQEIATKWRLPEAAAAEILHVAGRWSEAERREAFAIQRPELETFLRDPAVIRRVEAVPALALENPFLAELAAHVAVAQAGKDVLSAESHAALSSDIEARISDATVMELSLLAPAHAAPRILGWSEHRRSILGIHLLKAPDGGVVGMTNAVCERVDDVTLVPDWLENEIFNARALAGFVRFGPTAHAWLLADDIEDFSTLEIDIDFEPDADRSLAPPALMLCWRDATREDWTWVSLLIQDHPDSWGWLALAALTGIVVVDVLTTSDRGELQLVERAGAVLEANFFAPWADQFPEPPTHVGVRLAQAGREHVVGGLQAAERSKSYDLLELLDDDLFDAEITAARQAILAAEARRAEQLWGLMDTDDDAVVRRWKAFRELRAKRHSSRKHTPIDSESWLQKFAGDVATDNRAIVHMMVDEGLQLFWAADGGRRRNVKLVEAPIRDVLTALEPWSIAGSLKPRPEHDPVSLLLEAAAPVGEALAALSSEEDLDHLVLVPWRGLHSVPWGALKLRDGRRLTEAVRLTHAPALKMLRSATQARGPREAAVSISAHGSSLPQADAEVALVQALRGGSVVPDGASSTAIIEAMGSAAVVHLAGHVAAASHPLASALLSGDKAPFAPDRITSAAQIHAAADLTDCDLMIINACDSGRYAPRPKSFENHTGLDAACLCAGAAVVISTLWPVNDFAASLVAGVLHWHLGRGLDPHQALASAIAVLRDGEGSAGVPADLRPVLDTHLGPSWSSTLDDRATALAHPYWWAAWRISGADWLLDRPAQGRDSIAPHG